MVKFSKLSLDITEYKPKMKPIYVGKPADLRAIPVAFGKTATIQVKGDGEFNFVKLTKKGVAYAVNRFGRKTEDLPALNEARELFLKHRDLNECELKAEMYAVNLNGKPLSLPNFIHYLKGNDGYTEIRHNNIHLGIFDVISLDGAKVDSVGANLKLMMLKEYFNGKLCHVLDYIQPKDWDEVEAYWTEKVQKEGWEGLVIRVNGDTYKAKPNRDIDAVIIGINKNTKGYEKGLAKSVRVALMREDGNFVELGDATVPSEAEAHELFALTRVKVGETSNVVWVKPLVVVQISYISLFPDTTSVIRMGNNISRHDGTTVFVRMKSPRVVGYRKDKKVCVSDIGINQIEE